MSDTDSGYLTVDWSHEVNLATAGFEVPHDNVIPDNFNTLEEVRDAIRKQGLDTCNLIFGLYLLIVATSFFDV